MEITRNVILDLLPLYLANEVSEDTRALVENYLEDNPELAKIAEQQSATMELPGQIPVPLTKEDEMKAYSRAKWLIFLYIFVFVALTSSALVGLLAFFLFSSR